MKNIDDVCFVIQARLNSQRVPRKMLRPIANTNLVEIALQKILFSDVIPTNNFYFAAHENELLSVAENFKLNTFKRSITSANSENSLQEIYEWHTDLSKKYKYVILINACLPLLTTNTIDRFTIEYLASDSPGMFGVIPKKQYFWDKDGKSLQKWNPEQKLMNTKTCDVTYEAAHALYASKIDYIKDGYFMDNKIPPEPSLFEMKESECFDIDYEWQFKRAESILLGISNG